MSCIRQNQTHLEETDSKPISQNHSIQDQSHLMALTSEWGHSVFELHSSRQNAGCNQVKHPAEVSHKSIFLEEQKAGGMMHNRENATFVRPIYGYRQDSHSNNTLSGPHFHLQEKMKQEQEGQRYGGYLTPKIHLQESIAKEARQLEARQLPHSELPKEKDFCRVQQIEDQSLDHDTDASSDRTLRGRRARLSEEEIAAKRAAQAAAQREVRRRRRDKMSEEEVQVKLSALAANQRESRKRQREKMTAEELQLRRTISAITQREIRKRRLSSMTEEELKEYRAREASRQKELRQRKRTEMSEEDLKSLKAKEAALSSARRARRLGLEKDTKDSFMIGEEPDPSPS